jgi:hypothetical protein
MTLGVHQRLRIILFAMICVPMTQVPRIAGAKAVIFSGQQEGAPQKEPAKSKTKREEQKREQNADFDSLESEPYTQWSVRQVGLILGNSPWVRQSAMFLMRGTARTNSIFTKEYTGIDFSSAYQVRVLTALPVREALLRGISLAPKSLGVDELERRNPEKEKARLKDFIVSNPDNILVKGDAENIVISAQLLTYYGLAVESGGNVINAKSPGFDELTEADLPELKARTILETDSGKRIQLSDYAPPGSDGLGAKLFFKRKLPDGTYSITEADKELRLEVPLKYHKVKVKFDLKKMMYKGKLEL